MDFLDKIFDEFNNNSISGLTDELKGLYIKYLCNKFKKNVIVVTNSLYQATNYYNLINNYFENSYFFPMDDFITTVLTTSSPDLMVKRLETLSLISSNKENKIVVTNLDGFLKYVPKKDNIVNQDIVIKINDKIKRTDLEDKLFQYGYNKTSIVTSTGEYSVRGFIIDLFPYNYDKPIRIEFFGDEIDSIKKFDEESQLSTENISSVTIKPYKENDLESDSTLYDILDNPIVVKIDSDNIKKSYLELQNQILEYKESNNIDIDHKYMENLEDIYIKDEYELNNFDNSKSLKVNSQSIDNFNSNLENLQFFINHRKNSMITFLAINSKGLKETLSNLFDISSDKNYFPGNIYFLDYKINHGFVFDKYIVISENDIIGSNFSASYYNPIKIGRKIKDFSDIKPGDYVVHRAHGIGIYGGVVNLVKNGFNKDYIVIKYAGNDKVYIPVEKISSIYKYADAGSGNQKINSLNSLSWAKAKRKVQSKIKDISDELIKLYSERKKITSPVFKEMPEEVMFASDFEYVETSDQLRCINEVLNDLASKKPMDRLLCGDVGFGKTEVAFRGIFRTVINGFQAAYLCPTTILSKQQYENALKRFRNFPIRIEIVNRFTTASDFKRITKDLEDGKVDILFGTHKLFNENIKFKKLGLLVVDEEQRFGVSQKEKIKEMCTNINVLTLSATPIPRTLKMAMSGLRDLSILDTAPVDRYPIQTYVAQDNDFLVKEAIYKELSRKGQVYYLFNNVEKIEDEVNKLQGMVPEARICFAHGKMDKSHLEKIIDDFVNYKFDILVCTTIIETGIDISNVNTLIIKDAQNFGLSQLYQIRGRVGRTNKIAYAYLLYNNSKIISEIAEKRLNAIKEFTELGSGYKIAMRDLSIRGAGDLLGSEQAGFIETVGIDLFTKMVEEAVSEINGNPIKEDDSDKSLIDVNTHIDEDYVQDESVRIEIHQLINSISDKESLLRVKSELEDRFGKLDEKIIVYMYEEWFEKLAMKLNINKVVQNKNFVELYIPSDISNKVNGEKLFMVLYSINPKLSLRYFNKEIIIKLNLINLDKHYVYYLVPVLEEIINEVE